MPNRKSKGRGRKLSAYEDYQESSQSSLKSTPMIDGAESGIEIGSETAYSVEVGKADFSKTMRWLQEHETAKKEGAGTITVVVEGVHENTTKAVLILKREKNHKAFLNLKGNPVSFLSGQNVMGTPDLNTLIQRFYLMVERALRRDLGEKFRFPDGVSKKVAEGKVNLHSVTIAAYTPRILKPGKVDKFLRLLAEVYNKSLSGPEGMMFSASDEAGFTCVREFSATVPSLMITRWKVDDTRRSALEVLTLYSKEVEQEAKERKLNEVHAEAVHGRLRFDLRLTSKGLRQLRMPTLKDWAERAARYGGWDELCFRLVRGFLEKSGLVYAISYPNVYEMEWEPKHLEVVQQWREGTVKKFPKAIVEELKEVYGVDVSHSYYFHLATTAGRLGLGWTKNDIEGAMTGDVKPLLRKIEKAALDFNDNPLAAALARVAHKIKPVRVGLEHTRKSE